MSTVCVQFVQNKVSVRLKNNFPFSIIPFSIFKTHRDLVLAMNAKFLKHGWADSNGGGISVRNL